MSEKTEIPVSEPESPGDGANGRLLNGDSASSFKYLPLKLDDAERLLVYAAETGIDIDTKTSDAILKARTTDPNEWNKEIAANFLVAFSNLAAKLKPITVESIWIRGEPKPGVKTIKIYEFVVILLAALIIPFSLVTFFTSGISKAINADIQRANELAVKLGDQLRAMQEPDSKAPIQNRSQSYP